MARFTASDDTPFDSIGRIAAPAAGANGACALICAGLTYASRAAPPLIFTEMPFQDVGQGNGSTVGTSAERFDANIENKPPGASPGWKLAAFRIALAAGVDGAGFTTTEARTVIEFPSVVAS